MSAQLLQFFSGYKHKKNLDNYVIQKDDFSLEKVFTSFATFEAKGGSVKVFFLDKHLDRLFKNSEKAGFLRKELLEHSKSWVKSTATKSLFNYVAETREKRVQARLVLSPQGLEIILRKCPNTWLPEKTVTLKSVTGVRNKPHLKLTHVEVSQNAHQAAIDAGCNHALLVKEDGTVAECDWANIFWFDGGGELTSTLESALAGITQASIMEEATREGKDVKLSKIKLDELLKMSTIFITKSSTGIEFVESIDGEKIEIKENEKKAALEMLSASAERDSVTII